MLELFSEEIPRLDKLIVVIRQMLLNPKYSLEDISEKIINHISEEIEIHPDDDDKLGDVSSTAYNAVDNLIDDLEENETNCKRIIEYISSYYSYNGFNRLIVDFQRFLTDKELKRIVDKGRKIFVPELTEHWG